MQSFRRVKPAEPKRLQQTQRFDDGFRCWHGDCNFLSGANNQTVGGKYDRY